MKKFSKAVKAISVIVALSLTLGLLTGCGGSKTGSGTKISLLNSKGEILNGLKELVKEYKDKTGVEIEIIPAPSGTSPFEKVSSLYNSGNPPTMSMLDTTDVEQLAKEKALDLSGEKWVAEAGSHAHKIDGKVYSFPLGVEGKGLIYNKTAIEKALGTTFDPTSVKTQDQLRDLFAKLQEKGLIPILISKEDWSLGNHYIGMLYGSQAASQDTDLETGRQFINDLKEGKVTLADNSRFNGILDTFDIMREYNYYKADPLSANYDIDPSYIVDGKAAFWFNGNWAWPNLEAFISEGDKTEYGLMPIPISNDPNDYVNGILLGSGSKQIIIDKEKATPEQQQAAKDFLNWLVYEADGQKAISEKLNMVSAFANNGFEPADPLSNVIKQYVSEGKAGRDVTLPSDHWQSNGASMQKYLAGQTDRKGLAAEIEKYWKSKK